MKFSRHFGLLRCSAYELMVSQEETPEGEQEKADVEIDANLTSFGRAAVANERDEARASIASRQWRNALRRFLFRAQVAPLATESVQAYMHQEAADRVPWKYRWLYRQGGSDAGAGLSLLALGGIFLGFFLLLASSGSLFLIEAVLVAFSCMVLGISTLVYCHKFDQASMPEWRKQKLRVKESLADLPEESRQIITDIVAEFPDAVFWIHALWVEKLGLAVCPILAIHLQLSEDEKQILYLEAWQQYVRLNDEEESIAI